MRKFLIQWLLVSLVFHCLAAVFSQGYYAADEYFQILEFLSFKLGRTPALHLPVEFREQMRPWLQPWIYYGMVQVLQYFGIQNPFTWTFVFRLFTGFVGWLSVVGMALCAQIWLTDLKAKKFAVLSLALIWFFPALHVRPSSESLSASTFLIACCWAFLRVHDGTLKARFWEWPFIGILLGLSCEFRYQVGVMVAGLLCWLFVYAILPRKMAWKSLGGIFAGLAMAFVLGRVVDYWGYGNWVLSPWNYLDYNLIRGEVSRYGQEPWWDIFRKSATESWPFLGLGVAICTVIAWVKHPKHLLTWCQVPFFLVHEWIRHKELRFFFPIASAAPILMTLCFFPWIQTSTRVVKSVFFKWGTQFLLLNNAIALLVLTFCPMSRNVQLFEGLYNVVEREEGRGAPITSLAPFEILTRERNPYQVLGNPIFFYRPHRPVIVREISSYAELEKLLPQGKALWLIEPKANLPPEAQAISKYCHLDFQTLPGWIEKLTHHPRLQERLQNVRVWSLFRCQAESSFNEQPSHGKSDADGDYYANRLDAQKDA